MNTLPLKKLKLRILIIEDTPAWYENMGYHLDRWAKKLDINVDIKFAQDCDSARNLIREVCFHIIAIDLRLPVQKAGPLNETSSGIELMTLISHSLPLAWIHVFSAYASDHVLKMGQKNINNESIFFPPIWEKAASDNEGSDHYTQKEWAQRIFVGLLPRSVALEIPLVNQPERAELKNKLENSYSCLGENMDFAFSTGSKHLPPTIAHSFSVIYRFLENGDKSHELSAFQAALFLAESVQHWVWVQAAAWLTAMNMSEKLVWPFQSNGGNSNREGMESSLGNMCRTIAKLDSATTETWLSHLHLSNDSEEMSIVDALRRIREMRNKHHHASISDELPWEELAIPLRIIVDVCSFLASYPIISQPKPAADGSWRFTVLKGETTPLPETEWMINAGVLGEKQRFLPHRDEQTFYQLWPCSNNTLGLLKLWPFAEQRVTADKSRTAWLLVAPARQDRFWEQSALDGRNQCKQISNQRYQFLQALGLLKGR